MYVYLNSTWQTGTGKPESFPGQHILDLNAQRAAEFLTDAAQKDVPFFLAVAPVTPHAQVLVSDVEPVAGGYTYTKNNTPPVPQAKWSGSFLEAKVPRIPNFNPDVVRLLPKLPLRAALTDFHPLQPR